MATFDKVRDRNPNIEKYLAKVSKAESGDNPNAKNPYGSATGLFQFTSGTWSALNNKYKLGYTLEDRKNPEKAAVVMRLFTEENENQIKPSVGRELNDGDRYIAHFLGAGGATRFFNVFNQNPNSPISSVMSPEALKANKQVVYNKDGSLKTVSDIYSWASGKMNIEAKPKIYNQNSSKPTEIFDYSLNFNGSPLELQSSTEPYIEVDEQEAVPVSKAKQDIAEKSFVEDVNSILASMPPLPELQQNSPQEAYQDFSPIDMMDPYNYISDDMLQVPSFQRGGTIPDKKLTEKEYRDYVLKLGIDTSYIKKYSDYGRVRYTASHMKRGKNGLPEETVFYNKLNSSENNRFVKFNENSEENRTLIRGFDIINNIPKPKLQIRNKSRVNFLNSNNTLVPLSDTEIQAPTDIIVQAQVPTFSIYEQNQRMNGMIGYGTGRQDNAADIDKALRALEYSKRYNQYIEDTYNNPEARNNPKAQERYNTLRNNMNVTPNYFNTGGIVDSMGQWSHPGEITIIPASSITMQGVDYPVLGIDNLGNSQMMYPGLDYEFPGEYVTEYPQIK